MAINDILRVHCQQVESHQGHCLYSWMHIHYLGIILPVYGCTNVRHHIVEFHLRFCRGVKHIVVESDALEDVSVSRGAARVHGVERPHCLLAPAQQLGPLFRNEKSEIRFVNRH